MSSPLPESLWIHIGECPCCVNGLCRVRSCCDNGQLHLYAMCDECEALWTEPSTDASRQFPDIDNPQCPICNGPLYGPHAHWAEASELSNTPWSAVAIFDLPSAEPPEIAPTSSTIVQGEQLVSEEFITPDDIADGLDAPAILPNDPANTVGNANSEMHLNQHHFTVGEALPGESDAAYGEDEPKPGC